MQLVVALAMNFQRRNANCAIAFCISAVHLQIVRSRQRSMQGSNAHQGDQATAVIRNFAEADLGALYHVAIQTGDSGADASGLYRDPKLLGHIYAAPYALFAPELALVLEDDLGIGGYIVGALDTHGFEQILEEKWWPALRASHSNISDDGVDVTAGDDAHAWQTIHDPHRAPAWLVERHPSHLHINLLSRLQGGGHGERLLRAWIERARELGSTGFHLGAAGTIREPRASTSGKA